MTKIKVAGVEYERGIRQRDTQYSLFGAVSFTGRSAAESSPRVGFAAGKGADDGSWTRTRALLDEGVTDSTIQAASDADAWSFSHFQESRS